MKIFAKTLDSHIFMWYNVIRKESNMQLRKIRLERSLSVPALFRLSGVPIRTIEELERRGDGRVSTLKKLADALGITLDELCREDAVSLPDEN